MPPVIPSTTRARRVAFFVTVFAVMTMAADSGYFGHYRATGGMFLGGMLLYEIKYHQTSPAIQYELLLLSFPRIRASDIFQISNPRNTRVCSCDMYSGVPAIVPLTVTLASSSARTTPKSVNNARSVPCSSSMLEGFTSRWTNP